MYVISSIGLIIAAKIEESQKPNQIIHAYWMYFGVTFLIIIGSILLPEKKYNNNANDTIHTKNVSELNLANQLQTVTKTKIIITIEYGMLSNIDDEEMEEKISLDLQLPYKPQLTLETFCRKIVFYPLLFTFLIAAMPQSNQAIDYYLMYKLKFDSNKIGYLQIISSIAFLISVIIITIHSKSSKFSLRLLFFI